MSSNPIEKKLNEKARQLAHQLQAEMPPGIGFTLFVFEMSKETGQRSFISYISNAQRDDMIIAIQQWLKTQQH